MPILEHKFYASFIEWVVSTIEVLREEVAAVRLFQRNLLEIGSTPAEGSSKKATAGFPIMAIATH
ncbi:MAG: hypothetical protein KDD45_14330, partial [Bdellovibrionales bacterium]|nr:hypothetical protein [Bdellovibrionales bacterium]